MPKEDYLLVSSLTRSAVLMGKFLTGALAQLLTSLELCTGLTEPRQAQLVFD